MRSLLCLVLLVVFSVRNNAQLLRNLNLPKNIPLADPELNIPASIDSIINVDEFLEVLGGEEPTLDQNGANADTNLPVPISLLINTDEEVDINRANLSVGSVGSGDSSLYRMYFSRSAVANTIQVVNITYRGVSSTRVTAIIATEQGSSQNARATITAGGLGSNTVSIRLTSVRGSGFYYLVQIWGR